MLEQIYVCLWRSAVQHAGPQETAGEINNVLDVLSVGLDMCSNRSLILWYGASFLWLAVHGVQTLRSAITI